MPYAVLLARQQPPVAFQAFTFETFGGLHSDAFALLKRLQERLNQAIMAHEDVEGNFVLRRVSFIILRQWTASSLRGGFDNLIA